MRTIILVMVGLLLLTLESPLIFHVELFVFAPDIVLVLALYMALTRPLLVGGCAVFVAGILKDGLAGGPLGLYLEIALVIFYITRVAALRFNFISSVPLILYAFFASLLSSCLFALLSIIFDRTFSDFGAVFKMAVPQSLVTAPFAPVLFFIFEYIDRFKNPRSEHIFYRER